MTATAESARLQDGTDSVRVFRAKAADQADRVTELFERLMADPDTDALDAEYEAAIAELNRLEHAVHRQGGQ